VTVTFSGDCHLIVIILIGDFSMANHTEDWSELVVRLVALANKMEGEGQYNIAKLARAGAEALLRQAAYNLQLPTEDEALVAEIRRVARRLAGFGASRELLEALERGAAAMAAGRLPLYDETPHPYVCRTCGWMVIGGPDEKCTRCGAWPATFMRFPPSYWLDALDPYAAMRKLKDTPRDITELLKGLSEDAMSREPSPGEWSIRQVIVHLRDAQGLLDFRLKLLLEEEDPLLESKAVFGWAAQEAASPASTSEIFKTYLASRQRTITRLEDIPLESWWRTGRHEEFGPLTLRQQVSYFALHELTHLPQIEALCNL
jgi:uncharacterized damage-inducible protein DinB